MPYHSTTGNYRNTTLIEAVTRGVAPDNGLYMIDSVPVLPEAFFNNMSEMTLQDIAYVVANSFLATR